MQGSRLTTESFNKLDMYSSECDLDESNLIELEINFISFNQINLFSKLLNKTLEETIIKPKYKKFEKEIRSKYRDYLEMPIGSFVLILKQNSDMFYVNFLNKNGDKSYCNSSLGNNDVIRKKGIYFYKLSGVIVYIGRYRDTFRNRFNNGYGSICAKNCYIDGQSTNCHINSKINDVYEH